jgi:serine/threonine protein kinase
LFFLAISSLLKPSLSSLCLGDNVDAPNQVALHRDIKSANIGLGLEPADGGSPYSKILDCGLAKAVGGGGAAAAAAAGVSFTGGLVAGTAGYMAPEVANAKYTVQSEVFSFGVVLLEVFTGRRIGPSTATEVRESAEDDGIESVVALGEAGVWPLPAAQALAALIVDCLQVREKKRPPGVAAVVARLQEVRASVDVAVVAPLVPCCVCFEDVAEGLTVRWVVLGAPSPFSSFLC